MRSYSLTRFVAIAIFFVSLLAATSQAQEQRRIRPAFPIGAGEAMLVIPPTVFDTDGTRYTSIDTTVYPSEVDTNYYHLALPVGATLKRLIAEAVDTIGSDDKYFTFSIIRVANSGGAPIVLRTVSTYGIPDAAGQVQLVSNPMSHDILQGWTYFVKYKSFGDVSYDPYYRLGVIKIIYEP